MEGTPGGTLTAEAVEQLTKGIDEAKKAMDNARSEMSKQNETVDQLLKDKEKLEQDSKNRATELKSLDEKLENHAKKMEQIGEQFTDLTNNVRKQMKTLGTDGGNEEHAYIARNGKGTIFSCKQEARELGMFLFATQNQNVELRNRSRAWLKERAADLRFLPNIPKSFIEEVGNPILSKDDFQRIKQQVATGLNITLQDASTGAVPGAIFVHPEFSSTLIRNVEENGAFRANAMVWPMGAETVHIPRRKSGLAVKWEGEAESTTTSDPDFELLGMTSKKMMMFYKWSSEMTEDAAIQFADMFVYEAALAIALEEDRIGFNGTGAGGNSPGYAGFVGVLGADANGTEATAIANAVPHLVTGAAGANLIDEVTLKKLREMLSKLATWADGNAKWYGHKSVFSILAGIETTGGGPVMTYREGTPPSMLGYTKVDVDQMPKASAITASTKSFALGDLRKSWILGDRRRTTVETSEHYAFNTDQIAARVTNRSSFLMQQGNGMVVYSTGTA